MPKNMGRTDRMVRFIAGLAYLFLWFFRVVAGVTAFAAGLAAVYAVVSSLLGYDPLYSLLSFSTREEKAGGERE
ncbi:MAG TPA: DUF2892 domain-containing protein [Firmicutes bacterium]|nr:DUF2892 domain-containing protein [Bacillota bacterium]